MLEMLKEVFPVQPALYVVVQTKTNVCEKTSATEEEPSLTKWN
jgi:hypothetical protein